jgi:thioredoxin 1
MSTEINEDTFDEETANGWVVVDCYTANCGPCKKVKVDLPEVESELPDISFATLDCISNPSVAQKFGVMSVPTFVIMHDGKIVTKFTGYTGKDNLVEKIKNFTEE